MFGEHPRPRHGVCCGYVRADDGYGFALLDVIGQLLEHDVRPGCAPSPQETPREGEPPGDIVYGTSRARKHGGSFISVERNAPVIENIQHLNASIGGNSRIALLDELLESLRDSKRCASVARPHRGMHDENRRKGSFGAKRLLGALPLFARRFSLHADSLLRNISLSLRRKILISRKTELSEQYR